MHSKGYHLLTLLAVSLLTFVAMPWVAVARLQYRPSKTPELILEKDSEPDYDIDDYNDAEAASHRALASVSLVCNTRTREKKESYWCWKGWKTWRCSRKVTKTYYDCPYFVQQSSCYGAVERHTGCARGTDGVLYNFKWTSGCVGYFSGACHNGGVKVFDDKPSISKGCSAKNCRYSPLENPGHTPTNDWRPSWWPF